MHTTWNPRQFLLGDDAELRDEMCIAALLYPEAMAKGAVWYSTSTIRQVTAEVTWIIFQLQQGGDHNPIPIELH